MKRCDLHIHTVPSISDRSFLYDKEVLIDYVSKTGLDVIAITNHNLFDYSQFLDIKDSLPNTIVLPGIEVDLEKGHILVIGNNDDGALFEFKAKCEEVKNLIKTQNDDITFDTFIRIFSDFRIEKGVDPDNYPVSHTFFDVDQVNVNTLKHCLMDKKKVSLTSKKGTKLFQVFPNGQMLSTGLNIMFGKRSTGKTHTLNAIANRYEGKVKYIKQFELLNTSKNDSDQFESDLKVRQENTADEYLREFGTIVTDILKTCSVNEDETKLQKYLDAVMSSAQQSDLNDVFSKSKLFNENGYKERSHEDIDIIISAVRTLLESERYKQIINKYLPEASLKALLKDLIELCWVTCEENKYMKEVS